MRDLTIFISIISSLEITNVVVPDANIFLWKATSVAATAAAAVDPNDIKTFLGNGLSTFSLKAI